MFGLRELALLLLVVAVVWALTTWSERLRRNRQDRRNRVETGTVEMVECARCQSYVAVHAPPCRRRACPRRGQPC